MVASHSKPLILGLYTDSQNTTALHVIPFMKTISWIKFNIMDYILQTWIYILVVLIWTNKSFVSLSAVQLTCLCWCQARLEAKWCICGFFSISVILLSFITSITGYPTNLTLDNCRAFANNGQSMNKKSLRYFQFSYENNHIQSITALS